MAVCLLKLSELKCFTSTKPRPFCYYYLQSLSLAAPLMNRWSTWAQYVQINQMKLSTLITNPISQSCWILYPLKLPKTTASTTVALILASTASSSAEVMFLTRPAKIVSNLRSQESRIIVDLKKMLSYGTIGAWYGTLMLISSEWNRRRHISAGSMKIIRLLTFIILTQFLNCPN